MAGTPPRTGSPAAHDTDLIIIGGGPAGCAAARMAAGVGTCSILVEVVQQFHAGAGPLAVAVEVVQDHGLLVHDPAVERREPETTRARAWQPADVLTGRHVP